MCGQLPFSWVEGAAQRHDRLIPNAVAPGPPRLRDPSRCQDPPPRRDAAPDHDQLRSRRRRTLRRRDILGRILDHIPVPQGPRTTVGAGPDEQRPRNVGSPFLDPVSSEDDTGTGHWPRTRARDVAARSAEVALERGWNLSCRAAACSNRTVVQFGYIIVEEIAESAEVRNMANRDAQ